MVGVVVGMWGGGNWVVWDAVPCFIRLNLTVLVTSLPVVPGCQGWFSSRSP